MVPALLFSYIFSVFLEMPLPIERDPVRAFETYSVYVIAKGRS
jgi:hypothetical protein